MTLRAVTGGRQRYTPAMLPKAFHKESGRMRFRGRQITCRRLWHTPKISRKFARINNVIEQTDLWICSILNSCVV